MTAPLYAGPRPRRETRSAPDERPGLLRRAWDAARSVFVPEVPRRPWAQHASFPAIEVRSVGEVSSLNVSSDPKWTIKVTDASAPDELMKASLWLYAAARELARAFSSVPLLAADADGVALGPTHPLQQLLDAPAPDWSARRWREATSYHLTLTGVSYVEKVRSRARGGSAAYEGKGIPVELWTFPAREFTPELAEGRRKRVLGYKPRDRYESDPELIKPSEVSRILYTRPGCAERGFSPAEAAEREVSIDRQASECQQVSLQNRGVPDGIFKSRQYLTEEQINEVEERVEERWTDLLRMHQPWVLGQDLDWIDLAKTAVELELMGGREFSKRAIAVATGVPSVLWSIEGTTYANYETAQAILWLHTVIPQAELVAESLTSSVASEFGKGFKVVLDDERVEAMIPIERAKWGLAKEMWSLGVPLSQISERLHLGLEAFPGWDVGLVPSGLTPVDAFVAGGDLSPLLGGDDEDQADDEDPEDDTDTDTDEDGEETDADVDDDAEEGDA